MDNIDFKPITEHTITDREQLLAQINQIRRQGFAVSYGEINASALNIAAPVNNYYLPVALGILGPESRVKPKRKEFTDELTISGNRISENLKRVFKNAP
jgi:DNA-binding IclR family transcriptional regulator